MTDPNTPRLHGPAPEYTPRENLLFDTLSAALGKNELEEDAVAGLVRGKLWNWHMERARLPLSPADADALAAIVALELVVLVAPSPAHRRRLLSRCDGTAAGWANTAARAIREARARGHSPSNAAPAGGGAVRSLDWHGVECRGVRWWIDGRDQVIVRQAGEVIPSSADEPAGTGVRAALAGLRAVDLLERRGEPADRLRRLFLSMVDPWLARRFDPQQPEHLASVAGSWAAVVEAIDAEDDEEQLFEEQPFEDMLLVGTEVIIAATARHGHGERGRVTTRRWWWRRTRPPRARVLVGEGRLAEKRTVDADRLRAVRPRLLAKPRRTAGGGTSR